MGEKKFQPIKLLLPLFCLAVFLVSLFASFTPGMAAVFIFDRQAIFQGEVWRLLSCHMVHFSPAHLFYNAVVFGVAGYVIEKKQYPYFFLLY